jgi:hypothetical protein
VTTTDRRLEQLRRMAEAFRAAVADLAEPTPAGLADTLTQRLADVRVVDLPPGAADAWIRLLASLPRAGREAAASRVDEVPADLAARIAAWPKRRVEVAVALLETAAGDLERAADAYWNDLVRERVARAYL